MEALATEIEVTRVEFHTVTPVTPTNIDIARSRPDIHQNYQEARSYLGYEESVKLHANGGEEKVSVTLKYD